MNPSAPPVAPPTPRVEVGSGPRLVQWHRQDAAAVRRELSEGLLAAQALTSPKYLYDALGSLLFEAITALPEYYPTRTEASILSTHATAIAQAVGTVDTLVDLGAGNCAKALRLIPSLRPLRYVGVDISVEYLEQGLAEVQRLHPQLEVQGLGLDFSSTVALPADTLRGRPVFFYPGSSIGNFTPEQAVVFLTSAQRQSRDGGLLIGVDLVKATEWLEPAYDDALGVTAAFNLNLLRHLNRLLGSDFDPRDWRHVAYFNHSASRIEMHLEAQRALVVRWPEGERKFEAGERLHTENSYKYNIEGFAALLRSAGYTRSRCWADARGWFAVFWAQI